MDSVTTPTILRDPAAFSSKHLRMINFMVRRAIDQGILHQRPLNWVDEKVQKGHARGLVNDGRLTGFFVIQPLRDEGWDHRYVYGEACLWRHSNDQNKLQTQIAILTEAKKLGDSFYGARYKDNDTAREFYCPHFGYVTVQPSELPSSLYQELETYLDQIDLIYNPLELERILWERLSKDQPRSSPT
jgi:hypothetical protein